MYTMLAVFAALSLGFILSILIRRRAFKSGQNQEKIKSHEQTFKNIRKSKGSFNRLNPDQLKRLRQRYGDK